MSDAAEKPVFELVGATKRYGRQTALKNVSVSIRPGAIGLLGPNGAGKSTLIQCLLGLRRLDLGEARVLGHDVRREARKIREVTGYMPEDECFVSGLAGVVAVAYAAELAGLPPRTALRRAHEVLDLVGLAEARYREVDTYSTGMKQRVKLAQALVHGPKLVFLDEPTNGLDPEARTDVLALVRTLATEKGVSVVLSTHLLHDVEACCDAVVILGRGEVLVYDRLEALRRAKDESLLVRAVGDLAAFDAALTGRGLAIEETGDGSRRVRPKLSDSAPAVSSAVLAAAAETHTTLRRLEPTRSSLEEIFLRAVREDAVQGETRADL